ncbi:MAG: hypothetical protein ABI091_26635 [Ferruginibacter sp.]
MYKDNDFTFTVDNLLENIDKIGAWSSYGLAEEALQHYFPNEYDDETGKCPSTMEEVELMKSLGCNSWHDMIKKYHKEIGYKRKDGTFNKEVVNES